MNNLTELLTKLRKSKRNRSSKSSAKRQARNRLGLERLEERALMAIDISIVDSSMDEIGAPSSFVAPGSGGLSAPKDSVIGPDGALYVASGGSNSILRYNSSTGQLISTFVTANSGGLVSPYGLAFGPDGNLYVSGGAATNSIKRYHGSTGAFLDTYVSTGSGGLDNPTGIVFGTDGNLYVSNRLSSSVLRFQGPLGSLPGSPLPSIGQVGATFVQAGSGGLDSPLDLTFGPNGNLYVASTFSKKGVLQFNGLDGSFVSEIVSPGEGGLGEPRGLAFDQDGRLYVADVNTNAVHRYDNLGQYLDDPIGSAASNLRAPLGMTMDAQGALLISSRDTHSIVRYDRGVVLNLSAGSATPISVSYVTVDGNAFAGADYSAQSGVVTFNAGQTQRRLLLATRDDGFAENNESFGVQLSNATFGALISDSNAAVTIVDDEATRQIRISDASTTEGDNTAHYRGAFVDGYPGAHFGTLTFGPDGNLYTMVGTGPGYNTILRYNGSTGQFIDTFVPAGKINGPRDMLFRNGLLYVGNEYTDEVLRYDAITGAFVDVFVTAGNGGLNGPHGLSFGPDANGDNIPELYVSGRDSFSVVRFNGATGQPLGSYVTPGSGGLSLPEAMTFDPSGAFLFVASTGSNQILKYNALTGAYLGVGASTGISGPKDVKFGADGLMYVTSGGNDRIMRFNPSGAFVDDYVPAGSGGLDNPSRLAFGPDGNLYVTAVGKSEILRFGTENEAVFTVSMSNSSSLPVTFNFDTISGSAAAGTDFVSSNRVVTIDPGVTTKTIRVPILDDSGTEQNETFTANISNAIGGAIVDGSAIGLIVDNEGTKFYIVNDGSPDRTFEYGASGTAVENYLINIGNTMPRGVASNPAGDRVWVVDANKKVYVYNNGGGLLGSWTANSLPNGATIEGITVFGNDVWLVDSKSDRVYKYPGAANRTSGSHNAAAIGSGSFKLDTLFGIFGNTNAKDLVTDGTNIWVVDDGITNMVGKYTMNGVIVGTWEIDNANTSPTGITIDPTGVSQSIWIVDNGTDRVYEYANARSRDSLNQNASKSFALAVGNTNPQGIADPPPPSDALASQASEIVAGPALPEVDKLNHKFVSDRNQYMANIDYIFENWSEDGLSNKTQRRLASRR